MQFSTGMSIANHINLSTSLYWPWNLWVASAGLGTALEMEVGGIRLGKVRAEGSGREWEQPSRNELARRTRKVTSGEDKKKPE